MRRTHRFSAMLHGFVLASLLLLIAAPSARADESQAHYAGYAHGLHIFDLDLSASLGGAAYRVQLSFRLVGIVGALFHADGSAVVDGHFDGSRILPREVFSHGHFGGKQHVTRIDWQGGAPKVLQMEPPIEEEREPVSVADQANAVDTLSAVAFLLHQVTERGTCDIARRTFDGARLSEISAHTAGLEALAPTGRSSFAGPALRCAVAGRMIGGFMRGEDTAEARKTKHGAAWFARLSPGAPAMAVRIVFYDDDGAPTVTLYVRAADNAWK